MYNENLIKNLSDEKGVAKFTVTNKITYYYVKLIGDILYMSY